MKVTEGSRAGGASLRAGCVIFRRGVTGTNAS